MHGIFFKGYLLPEDYQCAEDGYSFAAKANFCRCRTIWCFDQRALHFSGRSWRLIPSNAAVISLIIAVAWFLEATNTVTSSAYASIVTLSPGWSGSSSAPQPLAFHLIINGYMMCPSKAEKRAGDKGSPCLMPDPIVTVIVALPNFMVTSSPSYILSIKVAASGPLR